MNKKDEQKKIKNFRFNKDTLKKLDELSNIYNKNNTEIVEMLIDAEFMRVDTTSKESMKKLINQLNDINTTIKALQNKVDD
jgi:hypothetical protein